MVNNIHHCVGYMVARDNKIKLFVYEQSFVSFDHKLSPTPPCERFLYASVGIGGYYIRSKEIQLGF